MPLYAYFCRGNPPNACESNHVAIDSFLHICAEGTILCELQQGGTYIYRGACVHADVDAHTSACIHARLLACLLAGITAAASSAQPSLALFALPVSPPTLEKGGTPPTLEKSTPLQGQGRSYHGWLCRGKSSTFQPRHACPCFRGHFVSSRLRVCRPQAPCLSLSLCAVSLAAPHGTHTAPWQGFMTIVVEVLENIYTYIL